VKKHLAALVALAAGMSIALPALAADEEIQVYEDDLDMPGQFGLDVHNNYVASGGSGIEYPGEMASLDRYRLTPEWSYGLTQNIELGAYLPLTTIDSQGHFEADGFKGRIKFIAPHPQDQDWYWGLNLEIGRVSHELDDNPWNGELKGILGGHFGRWTVATNLNLDFKVAGPVPAPATWDFDTKVSYALFKRFAVGFETYNGLGPTRQLGQFDKADQQAFAAIDTGIGKWDFNFGVGRGYGGDTDGWILKAIVSVPIDN
jgi:hypothetical protein